VDDVVAFLERDALVTRDRALKMLEFITHPLWRALRPSAMPVGNGC